MPPVVKRRRTRSRRTTRRLHRTRRQRGQRGGFQGEAGTDPSTSVRMELSEWTQIANGKWIDVKDRATLQFMTGLADNRLTLKPDTAPDIGTFTEGKSEAKEFSSVKTGQTLLSAIANIALRMDLTRDFANRESFTQTMEVLANRIPDETDPLSGLYSFLSRLEGFLQTPESPQQIDILRYLKENPEKPLYIWFAAANFDISKSEDYSTPLLFMAPSEPPTLAAPAQPGE